MAYSSDDVVVLSITAAVMVVISVLLGVFLRKRSEKIKQIPFLVITILLLVMEFVKQILSIIDGYSTWTIPLHFCSTYFIWFSIANFSKGKFSKAMKTVAFVASFYLVALFYFNPQSIIGDATSDLFGSFGNFHTFFFHHLVILYFCLTIALFNFRFELKHVYYWLISITSYYGIAVLFAHLLDTNYMNILTSNVSFMESMRLAIGQVGYTIIFGLMTIGVGAIIILIASLVTRHVEKKKSTAIEKSC